jgi:hypothetical protein
MPYRMTSYICTVELREYAFLAIKDRSLVRSYRALALRRTIIPRRIGRLGKQHARFGVQDVAAEKLEEQLPVNDVIYIQTCSGIT